MQPVTPRIVSFFMKRRSSPSRPITRCSALSRMAHVFTRMTSAPSGPSTIS